MPFTNPVLIEQLRGLWTIISQGVEESLDTFQDRSAQFWNEFWTAFPRPVAMLDAVVRYTSSIAGILVVLPIAAFQRSFREYLNRGKVGARLIRVDDAFDLMFESLKFTAQTVTFTGESGLQGAIAGMFGRLLWRLRSKVKLLRLIISATSEADLIHKIVLSYERKFIFYRTVTIVFAVIFITFAFAVWWFIVGLAGYLFFSADPFKDILPQDSKRAYVSGRMQHRQNKRRGSDTS